MTHARDIPWYVEESENLSRLSLLVKRKIYLQQKRITKEDAEIKKNLSILEKD